MSFSEGASNVARSLTILVKKGTPQEFNSISATNLQGHKKFTYDGNRTISNFRNITEEFISKDVTIIYF